MLPVIIIAGPTGVGKSELALILAKRIGAEIISADSVQIYRGLDIGSGKLPVEKRRGIPHHFIDILDLKEDFDAFAFQEKVRKTIDRLAAAGKTPIVVGGTGFYLRSLIKGLFELPVEDRPRAREIRLKLEEEKTEVLYDKLAGFDRASSNKINPQDRRRIIRALEIYYLTGKPISFWQKTKKLSGLDEKYRVRYFVLNRPREQLYRRLEQRVEEMFDQGWPAEVENLLKKGYKDSLLYKAPLGYAEIVNYLEGKATLEETKRLIKKKNKNLVRKQLTWFRKEETAIWIEIGEEESLADVSARIKNRIT